MSLVNGIPDSALSGYVQVKDAIIAHNTFVDCRQSIAVGLGVSGKQSLVPVNCTIAYNLLVNQEYPLVEQVAEPQRMTWLGNVFQGPTSEITSQPGFRQADVEKSLDDDGVFRFQPIGADGEIAAFVADDIDGQPRTGQPQVGCDQTSDAAVTRRPLTSVDVGPDWM